jgi:hypothetical protein
VSPYDIAIRNPEVSSALNRQKSLKFAQMAVNMAVKVWALVIGPWPTIFPSSTRQSFASGSLLVGVWCVNSYETMELP